MLRSMTGFGSASGIVDGVEYAVEIRSVNNRYFKAVCKLPESFSAAETEIEGMLRSHLNRGTVVLTVRMKVPDEKAVYRVNAAALAGYVDQLKPLEVEANPMFRVDLGSLLQLPGVCEPPPLAELVERTGEGLMRLISKAIDALLQMRRDEGETIRTDLLGHCAVVEERLAAVTKKAPQVVKDYHERLSARVKELTLAGNVKIDEEHLAREVAIFAERCDISEEIARLTAHVQHFRQAVKSPEPAGRKLEFIGQEMLREANTIASKANDSEIAQAVVEMKTAIDRIKEQLQNVE
ncbi:MAG: YicC/YloC family endoribonuclease [Planctomycetota bacterium]|nr:YicC/YloC family endoribonuclease [Planctomycetota bacterium]